MNKALLIGINAYNLEHSPLRGCVNDTLRLGAILRQFYNFSEDNIRFLHNEAASRAAILAEAEWLIMAAQPGDVLVCHFSGHGSQVDDDDSDEWDCVDEILIPQDHDWQHPLRDDELKQIFDKIPTGVNLTFIADACHSGTINKEGGETEQTRTLLVPPEIQERIARKVAQRNRDYQAHFNQTYLRWQQKYSPADLDAQLQTLIARDLARYKSNRVAKTSEKQVTGEKSILLAACQAKQTSAETLIGDDWQGVFTHFLVQTIQDAEGDLTYSELIEQVGTHLAGYQQIPQLECSSHSKEQLVFRPFQNRHYRF